MDEDEGDDGPDIIVSVFKYFFFSSNFSIFLERFRRRIIKE